MVERLVEYGSESAKLFSGGLARDLGNRLPFLL